MNSPNPLKPEYDSLGTGIADTFGMLFQLSNHLKAQKTDLIERFSNGNFDPNYTLMGSTLIIGDLTGKTKNGYKITFPTGYSYYLKVGEIEEKMNELINREAMKSVANCYELLEKFMFDVTAKFLFLHQQQHHTLITNKLKTQPRGLDGYKKSIRQLRGKNNKDILSTLRKLSTYFTEAEVSNNQNLNLKEWFEVLSRVRHGIVHTKFTVLKDSKHPLSSTQQSIFNRFFPNRENSDCYELLLEQEDSDKLMELIAEYGLLIFKSLSIEAGYEWKVFNHMDGFPQWINDL